MEQPRSNRIRCTEPLQQPETTVIFIILAVKCSFITFTTKDTYIGHMKMGLALIALMMLI